MEKISLAVRVRPPSSQDAQNGNRWRISENSITLHSATNSAVPTQSYVFDHVFGTQTQNAELYEIHVKEVIMSAVEGFNGTVFAYGQTSSGKTYTMQGSPQDPGIIHLAVRDVFSVIETIVDREFLIRVSYLEIYNEEVNDLLVPENRKLPLHENFERGIYVSGLREEIVSSDKQILELLAFGDSHRHFGETNMNLYSSRSHTIFCMVIESRAKLNGPDIGMESSDIVRVSTINMVDLAGSERISKTGAGGVRLKEGTHINKSLMTLGTVINKLSESAGKHGCHIPFRDSKLTRILQSALCGNTKTAIICTIAPDEIHLDESRGTLQFANRANKVTTSPQVNEILTDAALLKRQKKEIEELRQRLQGLQSQDFEQKILDLQNEASKLKLEKEKLALEAEEAKRAHMEVEQRMKEQEREIEILRNLAENDAQKHAEQDQSALFDRSLVSIREDRFLTPSTQLGLVLDQESNAFWSASSRVNLRTGIGEDGSVSDFKSIADEETWLKLNKGHSTFGFSSCERSQKFSCAESSKERRNSMLQLELNKLQAQHNELRIRYNAKEIEAARNIQQFDTVCRENLMLKNQLAIQLVFKHNMEQALADLGQEMKSVKCSIDSLRGFLMDCKNFQGFIISELKGFLSLKKLIGKLNEDDNVKPLLQNRFGPEKEDVMLEIDMESPLVREQKGFIQENSEGRNIVWKTAAGAATNHCNVKKHEKDLRGVQKMARDLNVLIHKERAICDDMASQKYLADPKQLKVIMERGKEGNKVENLFTLGTYYDMLQSFRILRWFFKSLVSKKSDMV